MAVAAAASGPPSGPQGQAQEGALSQVLPGLWRCSHEGGRGLLRPRAGPENLLPMVVALPAASGDLPLAVPVGQLLGWRSPWASSRARVPEAEQRAGALLSSSSVPLRAGAAAQESLGLEGNGGGGLVAGLSKASDAKHSLNPRVAET